MKKNHLAWFAVASLMGISAARADVELIAVGRISGTYEDLAHKTSTALENGVPGDRLGGIGSGLAYAGGTTFLALPDRGPNAVPYDSSIDDTTSYIERFHTFDLSLLQSDAGSALPFTLTPTLRSTTLLSSRTPLVYGSGAGLGVGSGQPALNTPRRFYFAGRSDNFDGSRLSTNPNNGRLDAESIRVSRDGQSVFISDEYGPYVYQFDRGTGTRIRAFKIPDKFAVTNLSSQGATEIGGNNSGRVANKGMEGLAITPDGRTLVGVMQSPLIQDGGTDGATTRLLKIDVLTGAVREYAYPLTNLSAPGKAPKYPTISDIVAVNDHQFLLDERDGKGLGDNSTAVFKRLYLIDLNGAEEVSGITGAANLAPKAVTKTLFLDAVTLLNGAGFASTDIPAKLEGIAFGPDVSVGGSNKHTIFVANDNDYIATVTDSNHPAGLDNPNRWFVFAFDDADLPGLVPQKIGDFDCDAHHDDDDR